MAGRKAPGANSNARITNDKVTRIGGSGGRAIEGGIPEAGRPGRGSALQGPRQDAKGGPEGANQGGAPRGGSRVEPSHAHDMHRKDRQLRSKRKGD
ncbi:MAG TPA: hypothetical protein VD997_12525 [Phycisphaerales bacterium]|nr:hypothetical protein [Phycisphaerales bacterium]